MDNKTKQKQIEEVRKKTAKEILYEIDKALHDLGMFFADKGHKDYCAVCELVHLRIISKIAQEYGVESGKLETYILEK